MSELSAYLTLKRQVRRGRWRRFENAVGPGDPDIYVVIDGVHTWLEAKELHGRLKGPWRVDNLRPEQEGEIWRLRNVGARVYMLLHRPGKFWLVDASQWNLNELKAGVDKAWLEANSSAVASVFPPYAPHVGFTSIDKQIKIPG